MKIKFLIILLIMITAAGTMASDVFSQLSLKVNPQIMDGPEDPVLGDDTTATSNHPQQSIGPETPSESTPQSAPTDKVKKPWPTGALLRSVVIPGWGQVYNKQYIKAVIYGGTEIALAYTTSHYWKQMDTHQKNFTNSTDRTYQAQEYFYYQNSRDNRNLFLWLTGLTFFVSIFDAYVDAHFADFDQPDKAFQANFIPKSDGLYLSLNFNIK